MIVIASPWFRSGGARGKQGTVGFIRSYLKMALDIVSLHLGLDKISHRDPVKNTKQYFMECHDSHVKDAADHTISNGIVAFQWVNFNILKKKRPNNYEEDCKVTSYNPAQDGGLTY